MKLRLSYWRWLFRGYGDRPGILRLFSFSSIFLLVISSLCPFFTQINLVDAAKTVLLPVLGIFMGLTFAWSGNAQTILLSKEMEEIEKRFPGKIEDYIFSYQTAIFLCIISIVLWGLIGLEVGKKWYDCENLILWHVLFSFLIFTTSMTIWSSWKASMATQWMIIFRKEIRKVLREKKEEHDQNRNGE